MDTPQKVILANSRNKGTITAGTGIAEPLQLATGKWEPFKKQFSHYPLGVSTCSQFNKIHVC